jgi:hypothetical protein
MSLRLEQGPSVSKPSLLRRSGRMRYAKTPERRNQTFGVEKSARVGPRCEPGACLCGPVVFFPCFASHRPMAIRLVSQDPSEMASTETCCSPASHRSSIFPMLLPSSSNDSTHCAPEIHILMSSLACFKCVEEMKSRRLELTPFSARQGHRSGSICSHALGFNWTRATPSMAKAIL